MASQILPLDQLKKNIKSSVYNKSKYRVDQEIQGVFYTMQRYSANHQAIPEPKFIDDDVMPEDASSNYLFDRGLVPQFQRNNDKWTSQMKSSFVENLIKGHRSDVMMYTTKDRYAENGYGSLAILDGLQRLSALCDFVGGKIKAFGYSFQELTDARILNWSTTYGVSIYTFSNDIDAAVYYIQMNQNITHSASDIDRAKSYVENNLAIECLSVEYMTASKEQFIQTAHSIHGSDIQIIDSGDSKITITKNANIGDIEFSVLIGVHEFKHDVVTWLANKPVSDYQLS